MIISMVQPAFAQVLRLPSLNIRGQTPPMQVDLSNPSKPSVVKSENRTPAAEEKPDPKEATQENETTAPMEVVADRKDVPARTVFVDMEPVPGAASYEVQVMAKSQRWSDPYSFEIQSSKLRFRLTPGRYTLRTRSKDENGKPGYWGKWQPFWIQFHAPTEVYPGVNAVIVPKGSGSERVVFEWPAVKRAKAYSLRLYSKKGKLLRNIRTVNTWQTINLELNTDYAWNVQPLTSIKEPDIPLNPEQLVSFRVGTPEKELRGLAIEIPPVKRAVNYQFEFVKFITGDKTSEPTMYTSREPTFRARLEPGEYEMRVRSEFEDSSVSDWSSPHRFWIQAATPKLVQPAQNAKLEPDDDLESKVTLRWEATKNAKSYRVRIWDEKNNLVSSRKTNKTTVEVGLPHDQNYRWHVTALLEREIERNPAAESSAPPSPSGEFSLAHYTRLNLSQSEEPSQLYIWTRYLTSVMDYQSNNYDNNTQLDQKVFGGIGEFAGGYWHRKSSYGVLGTAALSGFTMQNKTYTYSHASVLMGYRTSAPGSNRWRIWVGPAFHQTPEILIDGVSNRIYFARIQSLGPEIRAIYMRDLQGNYGMQIYGSAYFGMNGLDTPNGRGFKSARLYNAGVFGTYKFNAQTVGLLGYSYQVESGSYQSGDTFTNGLNNFEFSGHFLSATIQIGLEKPQR